MKLHFLKSFLIVFVLLAAACGRESTPQEHMAKAKQYVEAGKYAEAGIELKNAARQTPDDPEIRHELAKLSLTRGDGLTAEKEARRAVELGKTPDEMTLLLVKALYLQGNFNGVLEATDGVSDQLDNSVTAEILGYRAHALIQQQQYRSADAIIKVALETYQDSVTALLAKAIYEARVGRREMAMEFAKRAVEVDPHSPDGWAMIGDLYSAEQKLQEAKEAYDRAISNRPYLSLASARRAFILAQLGEFDASENDIRVLMKSGLATQSYVNFVKGYLAFQQADYLAASEALETSLSGDPGNTVSKFYLVVSYLELGRLEQAVRLANQLYSEIPNSIEVARMLASINIREQDFDAARRLLAPLAEGEEPDAVALGMLGSMALMEGNGDEAADYLERLTALNPDNQNARRMLNLALTMRGDFVGEIGVLAEQQVAPEDFEQVLLSAAAALKQGQVKQALTIAENLQQQYPDRVEPLNMLAAIYLSAGDWRMGIDLLEQVLAKEPMEASATKSLAKIYLQTGEKERALSLISAYQQEYPQDQEANGILAHGIATNMDFTQSEPLLIDLLEKNPDNLVVRAWLVQAYFNNGKYEQVLFRTNELDEEAIRAQQILIELRGKALVNLGDYERASTTWETWVTASPNSVLANFYYAEYLSSTNQFATALKYLDKARELNPAYIPARIAIIRALAFSGDTADAVKEMEKLQSEMTSDRGDVWYTAGWLAAQVEEFADAEASLNRSLATQPTPKAALLLFAVLSAQGRSDVALRSLEDWHQAIPRNPEIMLVLGRTYMASKDEESAIAIYTRLVEVNPELVVALNNLAWLTQEVDLNQAIDYGERALVLAPENPQVLDTMASLRGKQGRNEVAEQLLRKAIELQPDNQAYRLHLARVLLKLGDNRSAMALATGVVENSGDPRLTNEARAMLDANAGT